MFEDINCTDFSNLLEKAMIFLDNKGKVAFLNDYYKKNYKIVDFDNPQFSLFEGTFLSSDQKDRLKNNGRISFEVLYNDATSTLSRYFPTKRLVNNKFFHLTIIKLIPDGYVIVLTDNTEIFNNQIDVEERNERWKNISVLGKEAYFQYDINTESWSFSDNFFKFTGKSLDRKEDKSLMGTYLDTLSKKDRNMLREQWQLSLVDSRPGDVFEYTFPVEIDGSERFHSARWTLHNDAANPVMYGLLMDINELTQTENALNDSLTQMSLLAGIDELVLWNYFPLKKEFGINREVSNEDVLANFGISGDSVSLDFVLGLIHFDDNAKVISTYKSIVSGEIYSTKLKTRIKNQNDNYIFATTNFVLHKTDSKGDPLLIMGLTKFEKIEKERTNDMEDKQTILIAEDIDNNYDLLNIILRKEYKLVRAINGVEAVKLYSQVKPDLILMDMKMPEMGGLEATRLIRIESQDVPIIAVTAFAFESDREVALEAGCNDFLSKPIDIPILKNLIKRYLEK